MVKYGFLYPGQASQTPMMALDLHQRHRVVQNLAQLASDICEIDLLKLITNGEYRDNRTTQVAVTFANRASYLALQEAGINARLHAGFSLGELSSFTGAKVISDEQLFQIVAQRAHLMDKATSELTKRLGSTGMIAVVGLDLAQVKASLEQSETVNCFVANHNAQDQVVLSGPSVELRQLEDLLIQHGVQRIVPLAVSGALHTPLMSPIEAEFASFLDTLNFQNPEEAVLSSVNALPVTSAKEAKELLVRQLTYPVQWYAVTKQIEVMSLSGELEALIEVGPKRVLSSLWRQHSQQLPCHSAQSLTAIELLAERGEKA